MKEKRIQKVDVTNDIEMVTLGIRQPKLKSRDPEVWTKTNKEKALLKKFRHRIKNNFKTGNTSNKTIPVYGKLIIYLKKNDIYNKTTISHNCGQSDIQRILANYIGSIVKKYSWNGKTYKIGEQPIWFIR